MMMLSSKGEHATKNNNIDGVADLSKAELRRLVEILEISHPEAVAAAMALILQNRKSTEGASKEEVVMIEDEERTNAVGCVKTREDAADDDESPPPESSNPKNVSLPENEENNDNQDLKQSLAMRADQLSLEEPSPGKIAAEEEEGAPKLLEPSGEHIGSISDEEVGAHEDLTTQNVESRGTTEASLPSSNVSSLPNENAAANLSQSSPDGQYDTTSTNATTNTGTIPTVPTVPVSPSADNNKAPPKPEAGMNKPDDSSFIQQQHEQGPKEKKKKRPPGRKRAGQSQPSNATTPTRTVPADTSQNINSTGQHPPSQNATTTLSSPEKTMSVSCDNNPQSSSISVVTLDPDESADASAAEETPAEATEEPQPTSLSLPEDAADATQSPQPPLLQPGLSNVSSESDISDLQRENAHTKENEKPKKTKKRPPGKRRSSTDNTDSNTSNNSQPVTSSTPYQSQSAAASGSVSHEVLEWQAERNPDDDDDDDDLAFYSFDGYAPRSSLRPYEDISTEACPDAGCYLLYDSQGGGKLVLHYSKTRIAKALAFYAPGQGHSIQAFKFARNHGRVELIGNCASGLTGRKNYFSGVCQFIRAAKDVNGTFWIFSTKENEQRPGLEIDVYVYVLSSSIGSKVRNYSVLLPENQPCCVSEIDAVSCLPKHADFFSNVKTDLSKWLDDGNSVGATIQLQDGKKPLPENTEGLFIPGLTVVEKPLEKDNSPDASAPEDAKGQIGCYLVYDADGSKLIQHYSKTRVEDAICFFSPGPGQKIPGFKFTNKQGRAELIGNCSGGIAGRKNYFNGVCQFVRAAKAIQGIFTVFPKTQGQSRPDVDIYVYTQRPEAGGQQTVRVTETMSCNVSTISAVACLPKHAEFFDGLTTDLIRWVEEGSKVGAALRI